jgi:hypothetical protein
LTGGAASRYGRAVRTASLLLLLAVGCTGPSTRAVSDGGPRVPTVAARAGAGATQPAGAPPGPASGPRGPATAPGSRPASAPASQRGKCNTPEKTGRFARCRAARAADGCRAAGGTWGKQGAAAAPSCACPTGQGGCPCKLESDCLAGCRAPMALNASRANRCRAMWSSCAPMWPSLGCWCWFGPDGQPVERCADQ